MQIFVFFSTKNLCNKNFLNKSIEIKLVVSVAGGIEVEFLVHGKVRGNCIFAFAKTVDGLDGSKQTKYPNNESDRCTDSLRDCMQSLVPDR